MSFPVSPKIAARLQLPPNIMDVNNLEPINAAANATAAAAGYNQAHHSSGNEIILAAVSSSINPLTPK